MALKVELKGVKELRDREGLTIDALAWKSGVSRSTVLAAEGGKTIKITTAEKIAKALKSKVADLIGEE
jgi:DNA-binding XRE family transcriptional regulator